MNRHKELEGILVRGCVKRREGLVGLVNDVVEGRHFFESARLVVSRDSEGHTTRILQVIKNLFGDGFVSHPVKIFNGGLPTDPFLNNIYHI